MNYEIKSVNPASVLFNSFRVLFVIGLCVAIYNFFIVNSSMRVMTLTSKLTATGIFSLAYAFALSVLLLVVVLLHNLWIQEFSVKTFFLQALIPSAILGLGLGLSQNFTGTADKGFIMKLLGALLYTLIFTPALSGFLTGVSAAFAAIGVRTTGIKLHLDQDQ